MSEQKPRIFWIGPDRAPGAHDAEASIISALGMRERSELDPFGPALFETREDAEAVLAELQKRFPDMRGSIVM